MSLYKVIIISKNHKYLNIGSLINNQNLRQLEKMRLNNIYLSLNIYSNTVVQSFQQMSA